MNLPKFLDKQGDALVYNQKDSTFVFYVPENYFNNTAKVFVARQEGEYVSMIGICNWAIIDANGKRSELKPFILPTMFLCKPREKEKVKNLSLDSSEPSDYILLKFQYGDEIISQCRVPQSVENAEIFFKMFLITSKIPTTIPYDKLWELFFESASLNGFSYGLNVQLFAILIACICRNRNDLSQPFCATDMKNMTDYKPIDIKMVPKYISPYTAITSENWDESLRAAILMKDKENAPESPLEKVITM